jgi:hypothetical protein
MAAHLQATRSPVRTLDNGGFRVNRKPSSPDPRQRRPNEEQGLGLEANDPSQKPAVVVDMSELYPNRGSIHLNKKKKGREKEPTKRKCRPCRFMDGFYARCHTNHGGT